MNIQTETEGDRDQAFVLPEVGEIIAERYVIKRQLGKGGMGIVFEAVHQGIERTFAVKFLRLERVGSSRGIERFRREARLLAKLRHEGIVNIVDTGTYRGVAPYIVLEHVDGHPLSALIDDWLKLSKKELVSLSLKVMLQLCSAMQHAHALGILHRDIKPDNILVSGSHRAPRIHLVDFGIGISLETDVARLTPSNAELGTPHYMSPEQAKGARALSARSDVYALGAVFYQLLTGKVPHPGDSYNAVVFHILTQPVVNLSSAEPNCPRTLAQLVMKCLSREPEARFANAGELHDAIQEVERHLQADSNSQPIARVSPRPALTRRTVLFGSGVMLLLGWVGWKKAMLGPEGTRKDPSSVPAHEEALGTAPLLGMRASTPGASLASESRSLLASDSAGSAAARNQFVVERGPTSTEPSMDNASSSPAKRVSPVNLSRTIRDKAELRGAVTQRPAAPGSQLGPTANPTLTVPRATPSTHSEQQDSETLQLDVNNPYAN